MWCLAGLSRPGDPVRRTRRRGAALVLVVLVVAALLAIGAPFVLSMRHAERSARTASAKARARLLAEGAVVHVLNGTRLANTRATRVADALAELGLDAAVPPIGGGAAERDDYPKAVIVAWNGAQERMPLAGRVLTDAMNVRVVARDDPEAVSDYTVIVGSSTTPPGG